jgi:hypothetical protein
MKYYLYKKKNSMFLFLKTYLYKGLLLYSTKFKLGGLLIGSVGLGFSGSYISITDIVYVTSSCIPNVELSKIPNVNLYNIYSNIIMWVNTYEYGNIKLPTNIIHHIPYAGGGYTPLKAISPHHLKIMIGIFMGVILILV